MPPLDVEETDAELVYAFDLPGLSEEQIQIEVQDDTLTVSGERVRETKRKGVSSASSGEPAVLPVLSACRRSGGVEDLGFLRERSPRGARSQARGSKAATDPARHSPRRPRGREELAARR